TLAYRLWQAPFADKKLAPLFAHNDLRAVRRVLDVGCGPGTNTGHFGHADYVGVDINPRYIAYARRRYGREFLVADVTAGPDLGARFDCVLVNSFLHHVDDAQAHRILGRLAPLLSPDGHLHALELVLPAGRSVARLLARLDPLPGGPHEMVFANDGSADRTLELLEGAAREDERVVVVSLSRNFGHQAALTAALDHVTGDVAVLMDGDLQDPPEAIPAFL